MIDIGANLSHDSFDKDRDEVIRAARDAGVSHFIVTGSSESCSQKALEIAQQYDHCYSTAGIHPHHAAEFTGDSDDLIRELIGDEKVVAVGETGLDYFRDLSPRDAQIFSFEQHIKIAIEHNMPLFLHQRDAHIDFLPIIKEHRDQISRLVVHCFTDTQQALFDYLDLDCYIGITGWVCDERRGAHLLDLLKNIPHERLLVETDAPYLMPRNLKPKPKTRRNEPKYLPHIVAFIAEHYDMSVAQLAALTKSNSRSFFSI